MKQNWKILEEKNEGNQEYSEPIYYCECSCGHKQWIPVRYIDKGLTTKCEECAKKGNRKPFKDLTNTYIEKTKITKFYGRDKDGHRVWEIICPQCLVKVIRREDYLLKGKKLLCEKCAKSNNGKQNSKNLCQVIDMKGKKVGKITILERDFSSNHPDPTRAYWRCQCDCGKIFVVGGNALRGKKQIYSCGCSYNKKENKIREKLLEYKIPFESQKTFENCRNERVLKFDFFVNNQYIIEYDGEQHFYSIEHFGGEEALKKRQARDKIKNKYCRDNNIPIIRIPFDVDVDSLTKEDLMIETSPYLFTEDIEDEYYFINN